jgi:5-methylcytosine-specific restriction endonuclease McrA
VARRVPTTLGRKRGYTPNTRGYRHDLWAREVKARADGCAWAELGDCDGGLEADHIVPLELGGDYSLENGRALCRHHNRTRRRPKVRIL